LQPRGALEHALLEELVHSLELPLRGAQRFLRRLAVRYVEDDAAVANRGAAAVADQPAAAEDPAQVAVRTDDPVLDLAGIVASVERLAKARQHAIAVLGMAKCADRLDGDAVVRRLEAHDPI